MNTTIKLEIPADHKYLTVLGATVAAFAELAGDAAAAYGVQLAVHEICANIIDHAYKGNDPKNRIEIQLGVEGTKLEVQITDNGRIFDPQTFARALNTSWEKRATENGLSYRLAHIDEPDLEQERGRGIYLVSQMMDNVVYAPKDEQNVWHLSRNL